MKNKFYSDVEFNGSVEIAGGGGGWKKRLNPFLYIKGFGPKRPNGSLT